MISISKVTLPFNLGPDQPNVMEYSYPIVTPNFHPLCFFSISISALKHLGNLLCFIVFRKTSPSLGVLPLTASCLSPMSRFESHL